jgi:hypothetical protein
MATMDDDRCATITPWRFQEEREALQEIQRRLADDPHFRWWSNFAVIADDGRLHHIDLLVAAPHGLHVIEVCSVAGSARSAGDTWILRNGRDTTGLTSPLTLAAAKARTLASLLQTASGRFGSPLPTVEGSVLLLDSPRFDRGSVAAHAERVFGLRRADLPDLVDHLLRPSSAERSPMEPPMWHELPGLMSRIGLHRIDMFSQVGSWRLGDRPVAEGADWQDYVAWSTELDKVSRRIRVFPMPGGVRGDNRSDTRAGAAEHEYRLLSQLTHPGIARAEAVAEHRTGPALVYQVVPNAMRLDHFLLAYGETLELASREEMADQLASAVAHAHLRGVRHGALSPADVIVTPRPPSRGPASEGWLSPRLQISGWHRAEVVARSQLADDLPALDRLRCLALDRPGAQLP